MHYAELEQMTTQLNFDLSGARVEQISDGSNRIQFGFKALNAKEKGRFFVVVDFRATHLDIYATEHPRKAPAVPQAFTMLLRKYLLNETVCAVRIAHDDRIVFFEFGHADAVRHVLIAELTGRNPNIFFIVRDEQNRRLAPCEKTLRAADQAPCVALRRPRQSQNGAKSAPRSRFTQCLCLANQKRR